MTSVLPRGPKTAGSAPVWGAAVWACTVAAAAVGYGNITLVDSMLLLAVLVIIPMAVRLLSDTSGRSANVALVAAIPVGPSLAIERGPAAAAMVGLWTVAAAAGALVCLRWWWTSSRHLRDVIWVVAAAYLLVGAGWLTADRLGVVPFGFTAPFVQLTAVHFHYAGFASIVLTASAWRRLPNSKAAATAAVLTTVATPIIAIGFTFVGALQVAGAVLLTAGLWLLAWVTVRHVVPDVDPLTATLLTISSLAVFVPMVLAVHWAIGTNDGTPTLSIRVMARFHGTINAVGFTLLGIVGWRRLTTHTK